ncbi:MAG: TolC family protein [Acidiferrobacterales bacterium]
MKSSSKFFLGLLMGIHIYYGMSPAAIADALQPMNLDQYYEAALKRSEVIGTHRELITQAEEQYRQARAARLPTLSGVASYTQQPSVNITPAPPSTLSSQTNARLSVTQPLFRGFREFAALRQTRALVSAQDDDYRRARVLLFEDVVQNFYTVLSLERDLDNYAEEINQNLAREKDLQARVRIGRSRRSEVLNVQATISTLRAEVEHTHAQLQAARENLAFLSGRDAGTPLRDEQPTVYQVEPVDTYLTNLDQRPDIEASKQRYVAAKENVAVVKGERLPSLDLNGNYYLERPGYFKDINWDVQLLLTIPLYSGGSVKSKVREAVSQRTQAELLLSETRRQATQEIRSAHSAVVYDLAQRDALENSTNAAEKSYQAQLRDYRLGLVTNLDVLQALTALQQNRRALDRVRLSTKLDFLKLQAVSGRRDSLIEAKP